MVVAVDKANLHLKKWQLNFGREFFLFLFLILLVLQVINI